jgi:hypothetical protein
LIAYHVARELLVAVQAARISNAGLRDQALRAAAAVGLNIAEAAGFCTAADARCGKYLAERAYALLAGLIRVSGP